MKENNIDFPLCDKKETEQYMIEMRRWFHEHPEISLEEKETSEKIMEELEGMGIPYEKLKSSYGLVATIEGRSREKTIAVRADMDALPITEETGLSFASKNPGVMHACGHDTHVAMLLGAAKVLEQMKHTLKGTVKIIFQAAEELGVGHREVLDYLDKNGGVDEVIGLHVWSAIPEGEILLIPENVFAGTSKFVCRVIGSGGHGARPDLVKDPIKAGCDLVLKFSAIPSNFYDVLDHASVSTGVFKAGTLANIIPSEVVIEGTIRYFKKGGREKMEKIMHQIANGIADVYGVTMDLNFINPIIPIYNDPDMIQRARELIQDIEGLEVSPQTDPINASDDLAFIIDKYKGFYGILGVGKKGVQNYPLHHSKFDVRESVFKKGSEFMVRYVCNFLK